MESYRTERGPRRQSVAYLGIVGPSELRIAEHIYERSALPDILGVPVQRLDVSEAACFGAALLAGHGVGDVPDVAQAAGELVRPARQFDPHAERHRRHLDRLAHYRQLYPALRDLLHDL